MIIYKHLGHGTATPNTDGWKAAIEDKTTASVTGESKSYTIGWQHGWICPLCGRSVNPSFMHCSCGGWRYPPQPTWESPTTPRQPYQPWYITVE